jgi:methionyl aminopeptidase
MSQCQIFTEEEIVHIRAAGKILQGCLEETAKNVKPGMMTSELDRIAEEYIRSHPGALPAFKGYNGYPATLCTSVNEECVHAIPNDRVLNEGDIISLDGGVIFQGLYTDSCITVPVGKIAPEVEAFLDLSEKALNKACSIVKAGIRVGDISSTIQQTVEGAGYKCVKALTGHGLGKTLHQFPDVPNVGSPGSGPILPAHTLIAIEPITSMGSDSIIEAPDGWAISTADGSLSAHFEHTVLVRPEGVEIIA